MDLNLLVLAGQLANNPMIVKHPNSDMNRLELVVRTETMVGDTPVDTLNWLHWSGVSDDELSALRLVKGDRVWVAGYVTSSDVTDRTYIYAIEVQKNVLEMETLNGS